jgi:hypothetical protein
MLVECFNERSPLEWFSRSGVECVGHRLGIFGTVSAEIGALGEVLTQESVGVLVAARQGQRTHLKEAGDGLSGAEGRTSARKGASPAGSKPAMPDCS